MRACGQRGCVLACAFRRWIAVRGSAAGSAKEQGSDKEQIAHDESAGGE
ncbi:hypothetical protein LG3211_4160 [Lysobacter gummosus]|nr:hypothetical protein LG3211_4160 [Lysobacter gummosus]